VYRGTWTNIDVAAKEYRLDSLGDLEPAAAAAAAGVGQPSEAAVQRAKVRACMHGVPYAAMNLNHLKLLSCFEPSHYTPR
jgi:hypothetical protein